MRTTLPHTEPFTTVSSALFNHLCEHISSARLHQEQSHLLQQDTNQDVSDTAGNLSALLHHIPAFCCISSLCILNLITFLTPQFLNGPFKVKNTLQTKVESALQRKFL